jgi:hypothetical protein
MSHDLLTDLDQQLTALGALLRSGAASPAIEALAASIMDGQRGKLVYDNHPVSGRGWCDNFPGHGLATGKIDQLQGVDEPTKDALHALLSALAAVALSAQDTPRQRRAKVQELQDALEDYTFRRGLRTEGGNEPKGKRRRGRKPDTDPTADKRVADAWQTRQYRNYEECGQALRMTKKQVKAALDRHRKRPAGKRRSALE